MTNDRELLELAAKAAGLSHPDGWEWIVNDEGFQWNPLENDGDALRLAVKLGIQVTPGTYKEHEATAYRAGLAEAHERVGYQQDIYAATRRAIVRAAAEIGRSVK